MRVTYRVNKTNRVKITNYQYKNIVKNKQYNLLAPLTKHPVDNINAAKSGDGPPNSMSSKTKSMLSITILYD